MNREQAGGAESRFGHPWHQRVGPIRWLRNSLRNTVFSLVRKIFQTDEGKAMAARSLEGLLREPPRLPAGIAAPPYPELGKARATGRTCRRDDIVFISGRFRSGSTLLWNLFRNLDGFTSYYEPLNERRWFDPQARGSQTDATHRKVSEYWKEYDGLRELGAFYREEWIYRNLFMDAASWDPGLKRYIEVMAEKSPGRPVLQFNRVDFRLPWLRHTFPNAKIIHLYRHPRDQWCSSLRDVHSFPRDGKVGDFAAHDRFYLLMWAEDLKYQFPFLEPRRAAHPYQLYYYLWKLSYLFGRQYAHYSLAFEQLVEDPDSQLREMFRVLDVRDYRPEKLKELIVKPPLGKWKEYADDDWFRGLEAECETVLAEYFARVPPDRLAAGPDVPGPN